MFTLKKITNGEKNLIIEQKVLASPASCELLERLFQLPYTTAAQRSMAQTAFFQDIENLRKDCKESKLKEAEKKIKDKDKTIG